MKLLALREQPPCHEKEAKNLRDSSNLAFFVSGGASRNPRLLGISCANRLRGDTLNRLDG
jgi:hypothetical protein